MGDIIGVILEIFAFSDTKKPISNFDLIEKLKDKNTPTYEFLKYLFILILRMTLFVGLIFLIVYFFFLK